LFGGKDAGCGCGVMVIAKSERAAAAKLADPTKSNRTIASELGISHTAINNAIKSGGKRFHLKTAPPSTTTPRVRCGMIG
jgi:hypothetical protein